MRAMYTAPSYEVCISQLIPYDSLLYLKGKNVSQVNRNDLIERDALPALRVVAVSFVF